MEKHWPKKPSDRQVQEAQKKDSDRAIAPAADAVCALHTWCHQGTARQATVTLNSHWGRAATGKTLLPLYVQHHFGRV